MTRETYPGVLVQLPNGDPATGTPFTLWDSLTGGSDITSNCRAANGVSSYPPVTDSNGLLPPFTGPDGWRDPIFVDTGLAQRFMLLSSSVMAEEEDELVSVKSLGATGDNSTDDISVINSVAGLATNIRMHFPAGTYRISAPITKTGGRLTITADPGAIIKPTDTYTSGSTRQIFRLIDMSEVLIEGLAIDGNSATLGFTDWTNSIDAIYATTSNSTIGDASKITVRNCRIYNYPSRGVVAEGHSQVTVEGNTITDGMYHGVDVSRTSGSAASVATITNNRIVGRGNLGTNTAIGGIGIVARMINRAVISNNKITNMSDTGAKTEGCSDVVFDRNMVDDSGKDGIKIMEYSTASGGGPVYTVARGVITNNIVNRINAWRSDGIALVLASNVNGLTVAGNVLTGGGTRLADGIRVNNDPGGSANYPGPTDSNIYGNVVLNTIGTGVRIVGDTATTRPAARMTIDNNRLSGKIKAGDTASGEWHITRNVINPGTYTAGTAIDFTTILAGATVAVEGNTIRNYDLGVIMSIAADQANVRLIRIAHNNIANINGFAGRIDCFSGTSSSVDLAEIRGNIVTDPTSQGTTAAAAFRIGIGLLSFGVLRIVQNTVRANSSSGTVSAFIELFNTGQIISLFDVSANLYTNIATAISSMTLGTEVTRLVGWETTAAPTAGTWIVGDRVTNNAPSELGSAGSKYTIRGWVCTAAGTPGTWLPERVLTGN